MTTRELILKRLEEIRTKELNFDKRTMRWKEFKVTHDSKQISEVDFNDLDDDVLVNLFERIIRRYYTQM